jgi:ADP-ribose pyrophosphatase YjhB (NUDIX family)
MRTSVGSFALITRQREGRTELLTQWNKRWKAFSFVGGHKRENESFRECLVREVKEELGLAGGELEAADEPLVRAEYMDWSDSAQEETAYVHHFFRVRLIGERAEAAVAAAPENMWLTEDEIAAGRTRDGRTVSRTVKNFLAQLPGDDG